MIKQLHIENFALIKSLSIELYTGLNIITGETGSGKSLLAAAVSGLFGEEISSEFVRHGTQALQIQGEIIPEFLKCDEIEKLTDISPEEGSYIISRTVQSRGKNSIRLNGSIISASTLKQLGALLFDCHSQNSTKELLKKENQLRLLDQFCDPDFPKILEEYNRICQKNDQLAKKLADIRQNEGMIETKKEFIAFQINELDKAAVKSNEYEELISRKELLLNSEKIAKALSQIIELTECENLRKTSRELDTLTPFYPEYARISSETSDSYWKLRGLAEDAEKKMTMLEFDPKEIDIIIGRLNLIEKLIKKHGSDLGKALSDMKKELETLSESVNDATKIEAEIEKNKKELSELNGIILEKRKVSAMRLVKLVVTELSELEMPETDFRVSFPEKNKEAKAFHFNGNNEVRFSISANRGQPPKYLEEVASGGEMARVMLVFKKLAAHHENTDILLFDEIESGVSGKAAFSVGKKIYDIADTKQVICITHVPQIAAFSNTHFRVSKSNNEEEIETDVRRLGHEEILSEIGTLLAGRKITENAMENALDLIRSAGEYTGRKQADIES